MKAFTVYRPNAPESHAAEQKNAPDRPQFQGVVFDDGKVTVRWLTACRSVSVWDSMDDLLKIHGRPEYGTVIVWHEVTEGRETETETETEAEALPRTALDAVDDGLQGVAVPAEHRQQGVRRHAQGRPAQGVHDLLAGGCD